MHDLDYLVKNVKVLSGLKKKNTPIYQLILVNKVFISDNFLLEFYSNWEEVIITIADASLIKARLAPLDVVHMFI